LALALDFVTPGTILPHRSLAVIGVTSGTLTVFTCYFIIRRHGARWAALGCRSTSRTELVRAALVTPAVMVVMGLVGAAVNYAVEGEPFSAQVRFFERAAEDVSGAVAAVAVIGLLVPVAEELLFRGVLFGALRRRTSPTVTVIVTAVVFGVYHVEPGPAAACTVMGLVLGWLRHRTGSIWPAVVMHATNNLLVGSGMLWYWCTR